jgi:spermidine synthase
VRSAADRRALTVIVFVVGSSSLGVEIAAARLVAPYFGASTIVWANTIATVLTALAVGYWLGGRLADRRPHLRGLCQLVLIAAVALAVVPLVARPFLDASVTQLSDLAVGAFAGSLLGVLVLVAGPVLLLGAVAPYAVRVSVSRVEEAGRVAGRLYAISTAGSLAGTFAAALVLIPFAGTRRTFLAFALALALVAALRLPRWALVVPVVLIGAIAIPGGGAGRVVRDGRVIHEEETQYQHVRVVQADDGSRRLELNEGLAVHSLYRPGSFLTSDYWDDFLVLPSAVSPHAPRRLAILGNAAGTTARAYGHYFPSTRVDAVEIDGRLTDVGRRYFHLSGPHLRTITADARPFLRSASGRRYDAIFLDAYRQPYIPFYLATKEFFALARAHLAAGGAIVVNVGHPARSDTLERAIGATMRRVFPYVARDPVEPTNSLLVGSSTPIDRSRLSAQAASSLPPDLRPAADEAAARISPTLGGGPVYTDDRAPVEWLIDSSIVSYAADGRGR